MAMLRRAARLRHGDATEQVEGRNDASCFFNSRSRKCTSLGRLLGTSRQRWSSVEKKGRRGRGGACPPSPRVVYHQRSKPRVGASHLPLVAGSSVHKPPAALPIDGNAGIDSSQAQHRGQSQCRGAFSHRRTLIDRVCATLHRGRPVSVAESSRRWPCRGQKENLLCVPAPKPSLHFPSHQKFRLEEMVQISILEDGGRTQEQPDGAIAMGNGGKTQEGIAAWASDKLADRGSSSPEPKEVPRVHCYASNCSFFFS